MGKKIVSIKSKRCESCWCNYPVKSKHKCDGLMKLLVTEYKFRQMKPA